MLPPVPIRHHRVSSKVPLRNDTGTQLFFSNEAVTRLPLGPVREGALIALITSLATSLRSPLLTKASLHLYSSETLSRTLVLPTLCGQLSLSAEGLQVYLKSLPGLVLCYQGTSAETVLAHTSMVAGTLKAARRGVKAAAISPIRERYPFSFASEAVLSRRTT